MNGSRVTRAAVGSHLSNRRARTGRILLVLALLALTVGLASVWSFVAQRQLRASIVQEAAEHLDQASKTFERFRAMSQSSLQAQCRILVEDPRLKSTLATEGIDAATVADILNDLRKLSGSGFLMVLTPEGRVFAEAGAPGLRGLDLSGSSVVKNAKQSTEAVVGSWILDKQVMDLSSMVIRYAESVVAYLVVGQSVDEEVLRHVARQTGVEVASALTDTLILASDADMESVFARVIEQPGSFLGQVLTVDGGVYVTGIVEISDSAQQHRLVLARDLGTVMPVFEHLKWMLWIPPLLVLVSVLFAASGTRASRRA